jgi:hypothetical protein
MNQTGGATQAAIPDWLTAILLVLAALGGLAIFGRAIWEFIFRPRFRVTFDNEEHRLQIGVGPSQKVSVRVRNRTHGPVAAESVFIFFPEALGLVQIGVGGVFVAAGATPKVMAGVQAGMKYVSIAGPQNPIYFNSNQVLEVDLNFMIPDDLSGDYDLGTSIWLGRDASRNFNLKLNVKRQ